MGIKIELNKEYDLHQLQKIYDSLRILEATQVLDIDTEYVSEGLQKDLHEIAGGVIDCLKIDNSLLDNYDCGIFNNDTCQLETWASEYDDIKRYIARTVEGKPKQEITREHITLNEIFKVTIAFYGGDNSPLLTVFRAYYNCGFCDHIKRKYERRGDNGN